MASLKEIRTRIVSVKSTRQITSAMKMVSAAKLRKAQDAIILMRPYANKLKEILSNLSQSLENDQENVYGTVREVNKVLLIAISSNKGLCGAFNANIAKMVLQLMETDYRTQSGNGQVHVLSIGRKASDIMRIRGCNIIENQHEILDHIKYDRVAPVAQKVMQLFVSGMYDEVKIVYNQFRNAAVQDLTVEQYLPILPDQKTSNTQSNIDYILEPSRQQIIKELIPKSLKIQLFKACLDSIAAEHGARMTAMHKATDNATELIKELQLEYNKARQASITKEILEIVGGAEALKG
jgi:F-type H+-transporting ATPase subunit gamma